jgi:hypothetical protein
MSQVLPHRRPPAPATMPIVKALDVRVSAARYESTRTSGRPAA